MSRAFIDANVFLYAVGGESPHRASCRELLKAVGEGRLDAVTSSEVLQEVLHVRKRRFGTEDGVKAVREAEGLVGDVLSVSRTDVLVACDLLERHPSLSVRDALHAATLRTNSIHLMISVDADFDVLKDLRRLSPAAALSLAT